MADEFVSHEDLVARIALNSKLTAIEVEEALEVLASVIQQSLQSEVGVDLLGVGRFSTVDKIVTFQTGESLTDAVKDPSQPIQIQRPTPPATGLGPTIGLYKHKVNVCGVMM